MNITEYLFGSGVACRRIQHGPAYTAQHMAGTLHVPGRKVAKTVLLRKLPGREDYVVAVLPATSELDRAKVAEAVHAPKVRLATPGEMRSRFPDCELGAVPPFGSAYGMLTVVDFDVTVEPEITFKGTSHVESIRMKYSDYEWMENPLVATIAVPSLLERAHQIKVQS